jgi:signal peptidase I
VGERVSDVAQASACEWGRIGKLKLAPHILLPTAILLLTIVAMPRRHEVDGLSMAPALRPGDIVSSGWLPQADWLARPRRFDCWLLTAPDGTPIIKRIIGLPGETVRLVDGDLVINEQLVLTPPHVLAEVASPVATCQPEPGVWQRSFTSAPVYDDADFTPEESRRLLPVNDIGLAAVIDARRSIPLTAAIRVGGRAIRWRLPAGRFALVAGRLDGHLVAAAWTLGSRSATVGRSALPADPPTAWQITEPWLFIEHGDSALPVGLHLAIKGQRLDAATADSCIEQCRVWRDKFHRLPPAGTAQWEVGPGEVFVLGDFPSGSRDSRHWGPLPAATLRHRVQIIPPAAAFDRLHAAQSGSPSSTPAEPHHRVSLHSQTRDPQRAPRRDR